LGDVGGGGISSSSGDSGGGIDSTVSTASGSSGSGSGSDTDSSFNPIGEYTCPFEPVAPPLFRIPHANFYLTPAISVTHKPIFETNFRISPSERTSDPSFSYQGGR